MEEQKHLGKKPPVCHHEKPCVCCATIECQEHYRQSIIEAAEVCDKMTESTNVGFQIESLAKKLRISAGVEP